jgi:hypothetical protein
MEKSPVDVSAGARLAALIEHRLRTNQRLFVVSIGPADSAERERARAEIVSLIDEMQGNVAGSGVTCAELGNAIDETIAEVRAGRK